jgi:hypothetical protein
MTNDSDDPNLGLRAKLALAVIVDVQNTLPTPRATSGAIAPRIAQTTLVLFTRGYILSDERATFLSGPTKTNKTRWRIRRGEPWLAREVFGHTLELPHLLRLFIRRLTQVRKNAPVSFRNPCGTSQATLSITTHANSRRRAPY